MSIGKLFTELQRCETLQKEIKKFKKMLAGDMPAIDIGEHCGDPYPCDFQGYCWDHVPEYSVLDLSGTAARRWALYRQGYQNVGDVPLDLLNGKNLMEVEAFLMRWQVSGRPYSIIAAWILWGW